MRFESNGLSMRPFVHPGDVVRVTLLHSSDVRLGEILLCYVPDVGPVAHRVMRKVRQGGSELLLLKGDAVNCLDGPVEMQQIIGRVTAVERGSRLICLDTRPKRWLGLGYGYFRMILRRAGRVLRGTVARLAVKPGAVRNRKS